LPAGTNTVAIAATDLSSNITSRNYQVVTTGSSAQVPDYDTVGNMIDDGAGKTYEWDAENRLIKITQGGNVTVFVYNGLGQRVQEKLNNTLIKQWVWCGGVFQPCEERNGSNVVTKRFYEQGVQIPGASSPADKLFYTKDHLGSVREVVDDNEVVRGRWDYDPYGRRSANAIVSNALEADMAYAGYYYHVSNGLYLTLYRVYDANLGKWLSRDPLASAERFQGPNLYSYVANNSPNFLDPLGLENQGGGGNVLGVGVGFFYVVGGEGGFEKVQLDDCTCQWFFYVGAGAGFGASGGIQGGRVGNVFNPDDYAGDFYTFQGGYGPAAGSGSVAPNGAYSYTGGYSQGASNPKFPLGGKLGFSGSYRYYIPVGQPFKCNSAIPGL
jgi:RHS repeat-associated protein